MQATIRGKDIFYTTHGEGLPILFLHGGLGLDHTSFRPWLDPLGDVAQLIYYDMLGNGRSTRLQSYEGITLDTWADEADALRAALGHERIVLFGHSFGGFIAQQYALLHGDHLAGLILSNTAPTVDYSEVLVTNAHIYGTPEQAQMVLSALSDPALLPDDEAFRHLWTSILPMYFHHYDSEIARTMDEATQYSSKAFIHGSACLATFNTVNRLSEVATPTLILGSRYDWITPLQQGAERMQATLPNAQQVVFENSGHFPFIEERATYLNTVRNWLAHLPQS